MAKCFVSYLDISGIKHQVEVDAESMYEAVILAVRVFKQHDCAPGLGNQIDVEIRNSVTHTVTLKRVHDWLSGGARSPAEVVTKERLKELLAS